jgi:2-phosphosulfolactate phosphatase
MLKVNHDEWHECGANMYFDQRHFAVRCEWGANGIATLAPESDVIVIVDVLSFSTCVDVALGNGALVYPYPWKDASAAQFAASIPAILAQSRDSDPGSYSLSPLSLRVIPPGTRLVLPSPNGATLSHASGTTPTIAGCLRNARAVAEKAQTIGRQVSVIPAGERWPDGSLRPALEDWIGAGAIIAYLTGARSAEADLAYRAFLQVQSDLMWYLKQCSSGRELLERGFAQDIDIAAELNVSDCVPLLVEGVYQRYV